MSHVANPEHKLPYGTLDASFRAAGGIEGIERLVADFYHCIDTLPEAKPLRDLHPESLDEPRDKLARFLCGWLGGPKLYARKYGSINIPGAHEKLGIGDAECDAWLLCMETAIAKQHYDPAFAAYLMKQLRIPAERVRQISALHRSKPANEVGRCPHATHE